MRRTVYGWMYNLIYTTNVILAASGKHDNTICARRNQELFQMKGQLY